jgi:hypothetical protein
MASATFDDAKHTGTSSENFFSHELHELDELFSILYGQGSFVLQYRSADNRLVTQGEKLMANLTLKVFDYIADLDCFVVNGQYRQIADELGLSEWNPVVWIGRFWTDVLKSLELSYDLLFEEARRFNAGRLEYLPDDYIEDLEERIKRIWEGRGNGQ